MVKRGEKKPSKLENSTPSPKYNQPHNIGDFDDVENPVMREHLKTKEHNRQKKSNGNHPAKSPLIASYFCSHINYRNGEQKFIARYHGNPKYTRDNR